MNRNLNKKRNDYISWDEYFMATAFLAAKRSKDPCSQVGACIVNRENKIVGIGYNGMPIGCSDEEFPWQKDTQDELESKYLYGTKLMVYLNCDPADYQLSAALLAYNYFCQWLYIKFNNLQRLY